MLIISSLQNISLLTLFHNHPKKNMEDFQIPMAMLAVVVMYILMGQLLKSKNFHLIHETSFGILAGMIVGAIYKAGDREKYHSLFKADSNIFFNLLLPVIIFAGGYNLKKKRFLQNFKYIAIFGFSSTLLNFLLTFSMSVAINEIGLSSVYSQEEDDNIKLSYKQMLLYSSTICATDSVAALTLISSDKYPKLFSVVFGEGMVNDAVSIILFKAISDMVSGGDVVFVWYTPLELLGRFLKNCILSVLMGISVGLFSTLLFKKCQFLTKSTTSETLIAFLMAFCGYNLCEMTNLSGVIGLLTIGIIMSHYQTYNMSNLGKVTTRVTFDAMSLMSEAFIYVYLGFAIWDQSYNYDPVTSSLVPVALSWHFTIAQTVIVMLARLLSVYIVYWLTVLVQGRKAWKLQRSELSITCFAGMIRGSVAFALIETLKANPMNKTEINQINLIQSTVLFIVAGSTVCFGTAMPFFLAYQLKPTHGSEELLIDNALDHQDSSQEQPKEQSEAQRIIKYLDDNYFKRWFIFDYEKRKHIINRLKRDIKKRDLQDIFDDAISDTSDGDAESPMPKFRIEVDETEIPSRNIQPPENWERVQQ